jgi:hypothetical protein
MCTKYLRVHSQLCKKSKFHECQKKFNTHVGILVYYHVLKGKMTSLILRWPNRLLGPCNQSFHHLEIASLSKKIQDFDQPFGIFIFNTNVKYLLP